MVNQCKDLVINPLQDLPTNKYQSLEINQYKMWVQEDLNQIVFFRIITKIQILDLLTKINFKISQIAS